VSSVVVNVKERDLRLLHREGFDDRFANASRPARDHNGAAIKTWIGCESSCSFHARFPSVVDAPVESKTFAVSITYYVLGFRAPDDLWSSKHGRDAGVSAGTAGFAIARRKINEAVTLWKSRPGEARGA
jgi:hypothetical protein